VEIHFDHATLGWRMLLLGGASGIGKSTVAMRLGQRLGIPWLQVDDFRLALIRSGFPFPDADAVPTFDGTGGLLDHGELLSSTIEVVIENHVDQRNPAILEGDAILPAIFERDSVRRNADSGWLRAIVLYEPEERTILENMRRRGRTLSDTAHAHKNWQYSEWLRDEAEARGIPTLPVRPWDILEERILHTARVPLAIHYPSPAGVRP
jgi:2-phosphoglycerate kinase